MKELFIKQAEIFEKYGILITYFSFKDQDKRKYRIYFYDENKSYTHNPIPYIKHDSLKEAIEWIIEEVNKYFNKKLKRE